VLQGRSEEAESFLRELVADAEEWRGVDHAYTAQTRVGLAICLWHGGQRREALELLENALPGLPEGTSVRARSERALEIWRREVSAGEDRPRQ
jgi:hypothetical protein